MPAISRRDSQRLSMSQVLLHCMLVLPFDLWNTSPCLPEYSLCVSAVHVGWPAALKEDDPLQNTCDVRAYIQHHLADFPILVCKHPAHSITASCPPAAFATAWTSSPAQRDCERPHAARIGKSCNTSSMSALKAVRACMLHVALRNAASPPVPQIKASIALESLQAHVEQLCWCCGTSAKQAVPYPHVLLLSSRPCGY